MVVRGECNGSCYHGRSVTAASICVKLISSPGLRVIGSSVGTASELVEVLEMAVRGDVVPHVSVFDFEEINNVLEKLARFEIGGRVVLRIPS